MSLRIGQVAAGASVNIETVRYYERTGMLAAPTRTVTGYRQYDDEAVRRIRFIKHAQALAFSPGALPLTPVAAHQSAIVASNILRGNKKSPDYRGTPTVVFTTPPLAAVGLTEEQARVNGLTVRVKSEDTREWFSSRRALAPTSMYKTITDEESGQVVGAHVLGPQADEVLNLFSLAVRHGIKARELAHSIYAYPTRGSDVPYMF